jgi:uncharacterized protein (TIGR01777 family)
VAVKAAITGATGLIGSALRRAFEARGDAVTVVSRSRAVAGAAAVAVWDPARGAIDAAALEAHDIVIHLAGESIAGVWTASKKRRIRESRVQGTRLLAETIVRLERRPRVLFSGSAFGIYGDRDPSEEITEASPLGSGFLADVGRAWEAATAPAEDAGVRVVHLRMGNVLTPKGGMLEVLLPLFRLGLGGKLGSGRQVWPWIALDEVPAIVFHLLEHAEIAGPVNVVAPEPVTNEAFTNALAGAVNRPAFFSVPAFATRLAPGGMGEEMLLSGARVVPKRLLATGYEFRWPALKPALRGMLAG